ncbi:MAG: FAD-dependent oxidoreductase [Betaproteobacteria bacterium]|nr:MAG: FAD-dependent oxidoreductase [Betaproteobacteria bacterium]
MNPIIIVGSGLAGYNTAKELRKLDTATPLVIISADSGPFYSKPMLSNALASGKTPEAIALNSPEQMAAQLHATVRVHTRVDAIDTAAHTLCIGDETLAYSKLVLALGADQIRLPIAGSGAAGILTVNDLDDYARFRAAIAGKKRVAIIGAGLIGCEFANDLAAGGYGVDIIDIAPQALGRLLPPAGGALLQQKLAALGVQWHLGTSAQAVDRAEHGYAVTLANGNMLRVDVVLSAVGLKPRTALAAAAGLQVNRGIVVNRHLEASAPDVYALGDCAEIEGLVMPYVMPIMHAMRALAQTLSGKRTAAVFPAMPVMVKTPACPTIVAPPSAGAAGRWQVEAGADSVKSLFVDADGRLLGFALNGTATAERAKLAPQLPPVLA